MLRATYRLLCDEAQHLVDPSFRNSHLSNQRGLRRGRSRFEAMLELGVLRGLGWLCAWLVVCLAGGGWADGYDAQSSCTNRSATCT